MSNEPAPPPAAPKASQAPQAVESEVARSKGGNLQIMHSRLLPAWLAENKVSLAFSTYHTNKLFLIGLNKTGGLSIYSRTYPRVMGLWASPDAQTLYLTTLFQVMRLENSLSPGTLRNGFDRCYVPRTCHTTGDADLHDISVDKNGRPIMVNAMYSCLCTVSDTHGFTPIWKPPFISKLAAEDRCHLNGLAMVDGMPKYVTCIAQSDVNDGWREHRRDGGVVIDIESNEVVASGFSMPHSPRMHKGKLWLLDSGNGRLGYIDMKTGKFEPVAFCPGYLRGLAFVGDYAVVGLSLSRHNVNFSGLPLEDELKKRGGEARCGIQIIDLNTGDIVHGIRISGAIRELYDVVALPGVRAPSSLGFERGDIPHMVTFPEKVL